MLSRIEALWSRRSVTIVMAASLILTLGEPPLALAGGQGQAKSQGVTSTAPGVSTDLSARRRHRRYYRGNPAAGLAIMGAMIGTFGAIAASRHDDDYYYGPGYYAGPGYYGPPPGYYAPQPYYYGPRVYHDHPW